MKRCKFLSVFLVLIIIICITAPLQNVNAAIKMSKKGISLIVGETYQLELKGAKKEVSWKSRNSKTASVSKNGIVTAVKKGSTTIVAKCGKKEYTCYVVVKNDEEKAMSLVDCSLYPYKSNNEYNFDHIVCSFTNDSDLTMGVQFKIIFYDKYGKKISITKEEYATLYKNSTTIHTVTLDKKIDYASYDIEYTTYYEVRKRNNTTSIKSTYELIGDMFYLDLSNSYTDRLDTNVYILAFKGSELVYFYERYVSLDVGSNKIEIPYNNTEYDELSIYVKTN